MEKGGAIYIMTNQNNTTIYIGVTSDLPSRIREHKSNKYPLSFTARYKLHKLVYFETFPSIEGAIAREKQLKGGPRKKKLHLINSLNPNWDDLFSTIEDW